MSSVDKHTDTISQKVKERGLQKAQEDQMVSTPEYDPGIKEEKEEEMVESFKQSSRHQNCYSFKPQVYMFLLRYKASRR